MFAEEIFSWYAFLNGKRSILADPTPMTKVASSSESSEMIEVLANSCALCYTISKEDADLIIEKYNLGNQLSDYLNPITNYDNQYSYVSRLSDPPMCLQGIEHNLKSEYTEIKNVRIIDKQIINSYKGQFDEEFNEIVSTYNQIVTYDFKINDKGNYYLASVNVEKLK